MSTKKHIHISEDFELVRPFIEELLDNGVPDDARLVYKSRRNRNFCVERYGLKLNIKAFRIPPFPNSHIYGNIRKGKAERSYDNARALIENGFDTPTPIAFAYRMDGCRMMESYYVCMHLDDAFDMRDWDKNPRAGQALPGMAQLLADLHAKGIWHKDFSPGNILVNTDAKGVLHYNIIDLNRMRFNVHDPKRQLTNLKAVYIDSPEQTARFGALYAQAVGKPAEWGEREALRQLDKYWKNKKIHRFFKKLLK